MADTIYTRALAQAAELEGSAQALANLLRVPENTLSRWMSGRAQMPLQAFLKLIEIVVQHEKRGETAASGQTPTGEGLKFKMGDLAAHCARCDSEEFVPAERGQPLRFTGFLVCRACGERVVHGNLVAQLAKDAVNHSRAMTAARSRRQADVLRRSPALLATKQPSKEKNPLPEEGSG